MSQWHQIIAQINSVSLAPAFIVLLCTMAAYYFFFWKEAAEGVPAGLGGGGPATSSAIEDSYSSTLELKDDLRLAGMESCNLVVAIDHTQSNTYTGRRTFGGRNLHTLAAESNLYEQAATMIARTLEEFDEDKLIPTYGFGSLEAKAKKLFSYVAGEAPCQGLAGMIAKYRELVPGIVLSGGTSFAPAILKACEITASNPQAPQFHILLM